MKIQKKPNKDTMGEQCTECFGYHRKTFMHMCKNSHDAIEIEGCPHCDDKCGFCEADIGGEG